jgi:hypothetical protein
MVLVLINIITLSMFWTSLALFGFLLSTINLYCYFKCRGGTACYNNRTSEEDPRVRREDGSRFHGIILMSYSHMIPSVDH